MNAVGSGHHPPNHPPLLAGESLDELRLGGLRIIQPLEGYRFSQDAVLLSHFLPSQLKGRVVDLGSGNGVIPLLLAFLHPGADIIGVELQTQMVDRARRSISLNGLGERISIISADIRCLEQELSAGCADQVVANPPFWKTGEGKVSHHAEAAMARHELTLNLAQLTAQAARLLKPHGSFSMIHRAERLTEIMATLSEFGLSPLRLRFVHGQAHRLAKLVLIEAKKDSNTGLKILPPLIVREMNGEWSPELKAWYALK